MLENKAAKLEMVLKLLLVLLVVLWINMNVVLFNSMPYLLQFSMKPIKCLTLVSKKILKRSLDSSRMIRVKNVHRIYYSLLLCLLGFMILPNVS